MSRNCELILLDREMTNRQGAKNAKILRGFPLVIVAFLALLAVLLSSNTEYDTTRAPLPYSRKQI